MTTSEQRYREMFRGLTTGYEVPAEDAVIKVLEKALEEHREAWEAGAQGRVNVALAEQREGIAEAIDNHGQDAWGVAASIARTYGTTT